MSAEHLRSPRRSWRKQVVLSSVSVMMVVAAGLSATSGIAAADDVHPNIIGGDPATETYGFVASLQTDRDGDPNFHACGGSLIDAQWVVTAAHCVTQEDGTVNDPYLYHVNVGSNDRNGGTEVAVNSFEVHPDWDWGAGDGLESDIALIKLAEDVSEDPVEVADKETRPGTETRLLGWGRTDPENEGPLPTGLRELNTKVLDSKQCADSDISDGELCTDNTENAGPCGGDSGGPALQNIDGRWKLIGATSRNATKLCAASPEVFTSIPFYQTWIQSVTG